MLTQQQADKLIKALKDSTRKEAFAWLAEKAHNETFIAVQEDNLQFILSLKRNPFELRLHLRTKRENIGLMRIDNAKYHSNPDGTELHNTPHIHIYREGHDNTLPWAEPIDWYDPGNPIETLERFLEKINARFLSGIQLTFI